jgi:hypothetical protein
MSRNIMRHVENLVARVPGAQDLWILGAQYYLLHIKLFVFLGARTASQISLQPLHVVLSSIEHNISTSDVCAEYSELLDC